MIRKSARTWISMLLLTAAGCNSIHDYCNDVESKMVNHVLAQKAWNEWSWCYEDLTYPAHFAHGFKDGYQNVLAGGRGCQPTLPPRLYWKPCYQTAVGRCKIAAWFDGFSHGALAAQQDGYGHSGKLPISPTAHQNLMSRKAPPSAACFDGMYRGRIPGSSTETGSDTESDMVEPSPLNSEPRNGLQETPAEQQENVPDRPYDDSLEIPGR